MKHEGTRGKRCSESASGGTRIEDQESKEGNFWRFTESALCACGNRFNCESTFPKDGPNKARIALQKSMWNDVQDQWWECLKTHEFDDEGNMTKGNPKWEQFERSVQDLLNLRSTPGSGNQWHDVSDGRSFVEDPYKVMVDCKFTESASYRLSGDLLDKWWDKATELGYHFALPVRLEGSKGRHKEWVAITLDDYAELVEKMRSTRTEGV